MLYKEIQWRKFNGINQFAWVKLPYGEHLQLWKRQLGKFDIYLDREQVDPHASYDPPDPIEAWAGVDIIELMCIIHQYMQEDEDGTEG